MDWSAGRRVLMGAIGMAQIGRAEFSLPLPKGNTSPFLTIGIISESEVWVIGNQYNFPNKHRPCVATAPHPPRSRNVHHSYHPPTTKSSNAPTPRSNGFLLAEQTLLRSVSNARHQPSPSFPFRYTAQNSNHPRPSTAGSSINGTSHACNNNGCGQWSAANTFVIAKPCPDQPTPAIRDSLSAIRYPPLAISLFAAKASPAHPPRPAPQTESTTPPAPDNV